MKKRGSLFIRLIDAALGCVGFVLLAYKVTILGTSLIGIGSVIIAAGGEWWV